MGTTDYTYHLKELFEQEPNAIIREISPNDEMYSGNDIHYFGVGRSALQCVKLAMLASGKESFKNILDFPCGHGRVLRSLKATFPEAKITACDLNQDGVDFCARVFGATGVYSKENPAEISLPGDFDLIWCGSLLTHLNSDRWDKFLNLFKSLLCPGGIVIFTVAGKYIADRIRHNLHTYGLEPQKLHILIEDYDRNGFGYLDYPEFQNYGISLSSPPWVLLQLQKLSGLRLLTYIETGWDSHQDVVACIRVQD